MLSDRICFVDIIRGLVLGFLNFFLKTNKITNFLMLQKMIKSIPYAQSLAQNKR